MSNDQSGLPPELRVPEQTGRSVLSADDFAVRQRQLIEAYECDANLSVDPAAMLAHLAYHLFSVSEWFDAPREWVEAVLDWRDQYDMWSGKDSGQED